MTKRSEELLQALDEEQHRGSTECVQLALKALRAFLEESPEGDIKGFAERLEQLKPDMAALAHVAWKVGQVPQDRVLEAIWTLEEQQRSGIECVAAAALETLPTGGRILTHSFSGTVFQALLYVSKHVPIEVLATESLPGGEGVRLAEELASCGVSVQLVRDDEAPLKTCDALWVGADALGEKVFLNKVGTQVLLEEACRLGIRAYLLCDAMKQLPPHCDPVPQSPMFEVVPLSLATRPKKAATVRKD